MKEYMLCHDCGEYFLAEEVATRREMHWEIAQDGYVPFEEFDACPYCGSDNVDNCSTCYICGKPHDTVYDACPDCTEKIKKKWNAAVEELLADLFTEDDEDRARDAIYDAMIDAMGG